MSELGKLKQQAAARRRETLFNERHRADDSGGLAKAEADLDRALEIIEDMERVRRVDGHVELMNQRDQARTEVSMLTEERENARTNARQARVDLAEAVLVIESQRARLEEFIAETLKDWAPRQARELLDITDPDHAATTVLAHWEKLAATSPDDQMLGGGER